MDLVERIEIRVTGRKLFFVEPHGRPIHLDEIVAAFLAEKFADEKFLRQHGQKRIIKVGKDGGEFDEHATATTPRKEGKCVATLLAEELGVQNHPGVKRILQFTLLRDTKGGGQSFDLAAAVPLMSEELSSQELYEWAKKFLEIRYKLDLKFATEAKDEYERVAREQILRVNGKQLKIAILVSGNTLVRRFALSSVGRGVALAIQKWPSGHVQIYASRSRKLISAGFLDDVAHLVKLAEPGEKWYYYRDGSALLNGRSPAGWGVPPTKLSLEQIRRIIEIGVNPSYLPNSQCRCPRPNCLGPRCGYFAWGLDRCQQIYRQQR